jgi:hypothetical protein
MWLAHIRLAIEEREQTERERNRPIHTLHRVRNFIRVLRKAIATTAKTATAS